MTTINDAGLAIVKRFEGFRSNAYLDSGGVPTIGWGSTWDIDGNPVTMDHPAIDIDTGEILLRRMLRASERAVSKLIKAPLNDNQFSAVVSFTYNVGSGRLQSSTLRMKLNREDYGEAADEFPKWRRAAGKTMPGLVRRRAAERALFLT